MVIIRSKKINYERELKPIYIKSMEANMIYMNDYAAEHDDEMIEYKIKDKWVEFKKISTKESVLNDSLFLRFLRTSIVRETGDTCKDFIVVKFKYDVRFRAGDMEVTVDKHDLRKEYYRKGVTYTFEKKNKKGEVVEIKPVHYKMLMRSTGKAKDGECVFIRDDLHHKAINFLTMGLYDLMDEKAKNDPDAVFNLVALSAYQTLVTATSIGYLSIPLENILIVKDMEAFSNGMKAEIVKDKIEKYTKKGEFIIDFESPRLEKIINRKGFTLDVNKAEKNKELILIPEKSKNALKEHGIRINGKYPGACGIISYESQECEVTRVNDAKIKNILWDGMGLIDDSVFPEGYDGFIYCRSHFFKSCLFRGSIQNFFQDYCNDKEDIDYKTHTVEDVDMFHRKIKFSDVKVIITDKSIKWLKFIDMMGGNEEKAFKFYHKWMKNYENYFSIVKTAHPSKWGDLQLMAYQMNNSLPTTDKDILGHITEKGVDFCNVLKTSDEAYLKYLHMTKNNFNINELLLELVQWNADFMKTAFFRKMKSRNISDLKEDFCQGKLPQNGDNLTIMDNPVALLLTAVGDKEPLINEGCFDAVSDGVQCYAPRFMEGERLAAFRSPHNSPNNIIHLYNVYPDKLMKYFPNIGKNVIVFNAIKTDTQARLSGHDCDSDFVYATNHPDLADLARKAYIEYPTIINKVKESGESKYHFTLEDYAEMDNKIADAQESIGTSTDIAQLALSYYYDGGTSSRELEECFIILSVIGQISIDLAKKTYDLNVVKEINRIKHLPCMQNKKIPRFFADTKKRRNNKKYPPEQVESLNCPMDIMAEIINENVIKYSDREKNLPLHKFLNGLELIGKGNKYKREKVIEESRKYNKAVAFLEQKKNGMDDNVYLQLKNKRMTQFLNRVSKNLDQETIFRLVDYATLDNNSDVMAVILNFLFKNYKDEFMDCFVKNVQK